VAACTANELAVALSDDSTAAKVAAALSKAAAAPHDPLQAVVAQAAQAIAIAMIQVTVQSDEETKRLTVDPPRPVHEAIAEAFGTSARQVLLFGDMDVLEGESFDDHGIEVGGALLSQDGLGWGETQREHQDAEGQRRGGGCRACGAGAQPRRSWSLW